MCEPVEDNEGRSGNRGRCCSPPESSADWLPSQLWNVQEVGLGAAGKWKAFGKYIYIIENVLEEKEQEKNTKKIFTV